MRSLGDILDAAKSGERPTDDECYFAMLACEQLFIMTQRLHGEAIFGAKPQTPATLQRRAEENFQMAKRAMATDPKTWLGPNNDWTNPDNRKRRETALKLFAKVSAKS